MKRLHVLVLVAWATACERPDEPAQTQAALKPLPVAAEAQVRAARAESANATRPAAQKPSASAVNQRCLVPLEEPAPAQAFPARACPRAPDPGPQLAEARVVFVDAVGQPSVRVEVAQSLDEKARGLMYRRELGADRGMLFPYPGETVHSFWMRNTCIPLDMLFIGADDVIVGALEQVPTINDEARSIACPSRDVLEVNAGWARANGVRPGQRVRIER